MKEFAKLMDKLAITPSRNRKVEMLARYFADTPDPDRGYALAILTDNISFAHIKSSKLKEIAFQHVDENLFRLSYDYVGDLGETIALIWPYYEEGYELPLLHELVDQFTHIKKADVPRMIAELLTIAKPHERWALIKMATGVLRIGVSARLAKTALAKMGDVSLQEIEEVWHGLKPPYLQMFAWLEGKTEKPEIKHSETFHPLMLSNPVDELKDFEKMDPAEFNAEWKWDGIRVQLVMEGKTRAMYSRTGDDISHTFPDIIDNVIGSAVLDGELLVGHDLEPMPFNNLQQRLNRKKVAASHLKEYPAFIRVYAVSYTHLTLPTKA